MGVRRESPIPVPDQARGKRGYRRKVVVFTGFGIGFFYRVALPGVVTVILLAPLRPAWLTPWADTGLDKTTIFLTAVIGIGLCMSGARTFIYYLFEGFYWMPWSEWQRRRLQEKIDAAHEKYKLLEQKRETAGEISKTEERREARLLAFLNDFPINTETNPYYFPDRPTRVGNVIASYELYAKDRYGIDGVFYWFHIRFSAPAYAQTELDRVEAIADGMLFSTFASMASVLFYAIAAVGRIIGYFLESTSLRPWLIPPPTTDKALAGFLALSVLCALVFRQIALFSFRALGKQFRAVVDLVAPTIVKLGDAWLPSDLQRELLTKRQHYLSHGTPLWDQPNATAAHRESESPTAPASASSSEMG